MGRRLIHPLNWARQQSNIYISQESHSISSDCGSNTRPSKEHSTVSSQMDQWTSFTSGIKTKEPRQNHPLQQNLQKRNQFQIAMLGIHMSYHSSSIVYCFAESCSTTVVNVDGAFRGGCTPTPSPCIVTRSPRPAQRPNPGPTRACWTAARSRG